MHTQTHTGNTYGRNRCTTQTVGRVKRDQRLGIARSRKLNNPNGRINKTQNAGRHRSHAPSLSLALAVSFWHSLFYLSSCFLFFGWRMTHRRVAKIPSGAGKSLWSVNNANFCEWRSYHKGLPLSTNVCSSEEVAFMIVGSAENSFFFFWHYYAVQTRTHTYVRVYPVCHTILTISNCTSDAQKLLPIPQECAQPPKELLCPTPRRTRICFHLILTAAPAASLPGERPLFHSSVWNLCESFLFQLNFIRADKILRAFIVIERTRAKDRLTDRMSRKCQWKC